MTPSPLTSGPATSVPAHRDGNALRWVAGYLASLVGDQVWFVALGWAALQAGGPTQVGVVLALGALPRAALMLPGGAVADRWGARRTALATDVARTGLMLGAAAAVALAPGSVVLLVVLAAAFGALDALFLPAAGALPQQLVAADQVVRLQALKSGAQRLAAMAGAPLGGVLVARADAGTAFTVAAALTASSVVALLLTRVPDRTAPPHSPLLQQIRAGLSYVRGHRVLLPLLLLAGVFELGFSGAFNVGLPVLAQARGWGVSAVGLLLGAWGAGAASSALALVAVPRPPRVGVTLLPLLVLMAATLAAIGLSRSLALTACLAALLGAGSGVAGSLFGSLVLTESAPEMVARVTSLAMLASLGLSPLSYAVAGVVAASAGPSAPFLLGAGIGALAALIARTPALRQARLPGAVGAG